MTILDASLSRSAYRPDIDGLRAIAVLAVVAYHAFPHQVAAGFIGVDIFFVISGYLISSIILTHLDDGRFHIATFYSRRIRRIFPALLVVMCAGLGFGWIALLPGEYAQFGRHTVAGAGFFSNFILWGESGYFDTAAETKPLLHLWSLAIEEQFYVFWPLILWFFWRRRLRPIHVIALLGVGTFMVSVYLAQHDRIAAFYSPLSRFWELMVGGALVCYTRTSHVSLPTGRLGDALSMLGTTMLVIGMLLINNGRAVPGWWALLPVLGAFCLIAAGPQAVVNHRLLGHRLLVWFGLISYPLYLWHWLIFAYARIMYGGDLAPEVAALAITASVVLAWATWRWLETPVRGGDSAPAKVSVLLGLMALVATGGQLISMRDGLSSRSVVAANPGVNASWDGGEGGFTIGDCRVDDPARVAVLPNCRRDSRRVERFALVGDSKAAALFGGLVRTSTDTGRWLFIGGNGPHGAPLPVLSDDDLYAYYQPAARIALGAVAANPNVEAVVLVASTRALFQLASDSSVEDLPRSEHFEQARRGMTNATQLLIVAGKRVVLLVDNPTLPDPKYCLRRVTSSREINLTLSFGHENEKCRVALRRHMKLTEKYRALLRAVTASDPTNISMFDTTPYLCDMNSEICSAFDGERLLYSYTDHISDYAAGKIGRALNAWLTSDSRGTPSAGEEPRVRDDAMTSPKHASPP